MPRLVLTALVACLAAACGGPLDVDLGCESERSFARGAGLEQRFFVASKAPQGCAVLELDGVDGREIAFHQGTFTRGRECQVTLGYFETTPFGVYVGERLTYFHGTQRWALGAMECTQRPTPVIGD